MEKKINYTARDFEAYKSELLSFTTKYYPELVDSFNDSSVGSWLVDLMASVSDNLGYHIDRMYQETNVNSANLRSSVLNLARSNGLKVPGPKSSMCEIKLTCNLPVDPNDISMPNWAYAPMLRRSSIVSSGNYYFHLTEDVDFAEGFNSDAYSNRTFEPVRDSNGAITNYAVSKSTVAIDGKSNIYKKVMLSTDIEPFMEIVLPYTNISNIESIIFKESNDFDNDPDTYEFYYDAEEYKANDNDVMTYRFFEVDSLADQYRFGSEANIDKAVINDMFYPELYDDYVDESDTEDNDGYLQTTSRIYRGKWKPITQKFITEYTDNGYLKIIFGSGIKYDSVPSGQTKYSDYRASKIINNDMLGVLPREGWTMYVLYNTSDGISSNLAADSINTISLMTAQFHDESSLDATKKGNVLNSMEVTNPSPSVAGKDAPSTAEIKYLTKYNTSSQNRCVTLKDYKVKLMEMPPKYGAPYRCATIEDNNKISMSLLGMNSNGKLDKSLPQTLVNNITEYLSKFKSINDYIEIKSGKIYNLGFLVDAFIDKNYDSATVVSNILSAIKNYMNVENFDIGESIFVGDLEKEITTIDGVISLISLRIYNIYNGNYSSDVTPFAELVEDESCSSVSVPTFEVESGAEAYPIDLDVIDRVLSSDYNSMFEIKNENDIKCRIKLR